MALFDSSGVASGTSSASGAAGVSTYATAALEGVGGLAGAFGLLQLASARFGATSTFEWGYVQDASASIAGSSPAEGSALVAIGAIGVFQGSSSFHCIVPLVIAGSSAMSVATVVDRQLRPIRAITMGPKTFGWLQLLQRGDLPVFICDSTGPVIPFSVRYRLLHVRPDGSRHAVGPEERTPVAGVAGEFYVTGRAGEQGQPGRWIVEWTFQRTREAIPQAVELHYSVVDGVMAGYPRDVTCRKIKFGWN